VSNEISCCQAFVAAMMMILGTKMKQEKVLIATQRDNAGVQNSDLEVFV
jgi:hypothetical protein